MLEPAIRNFLQERHHGTISFMMPDGLIATHVMWVDADDDHVIVNTEIHRAKYKAIAANPLVTVAAWDSQAEYRYVEVRGHVVSEERGQAARDHIEFLSQKYTGGPYSNPIQSERIILRIAPERQRSQAI